MTEQQVMLASAIAISPAVASPSPNRLQRIIGALVRVATWSPDRPCSDHDRHQAHARRTPSWYSDALMAREMWRL
ncbi:hypothetical protein BVC93_20115 [Mycobacterium sp. MS1601]|nr:hypothetical protein BVC93_20115 [Mycobacterium sp. MS1601]